MIGRQLKWAVRRTLAGVCYHSRLHRFRHTGKVVILTYHRVVPKEDVLRQHIPPGMYVLREVFDMHVRFLQEHYEILSFQELLDRWGSSEVKWNKPACVITFDDGWLDNYQHAYPILTARGVPATIFLATDFVATHEWFWPEKLTYLVDRAADATMSSERKEAFVLALNRFLERGEDTVASLTETDSELRNDALGELVEQLKVVRVEKIHDLLQQLADLLQVKFPDKRMVLNWKEIAEMSSRNISFGSHSCSHRIMTTLTPDEFKREIELSYRRLQAERVNRVPVFCYPNGNTNQAIQDQVRAYGYRAAVGTRVGCEGTQPSNMYELERVGIHNDITATGPLLAFHMLGPLL